MIMSSMLQAIIESFMTTLTLTTDCYHRSL